MQLMFFSEVTVETDGGHSDLLSVIFRFKKALRQRYAIHSWANFIWVYTRLRLSVPADILPAISAIAEVICNMDPKMAPDDYKVGLWRQHMPFNFPWHVVASTTRLRPSYRAASWSWASVHGEIFGTTAERSRYHPDCIAAEVAYIKTQLASNKASFGQVLNGELHIEGLIKNFPHYAMEGGKVQLFEEQDGCEETLSLSLSMPSSLNSLSVLRLILWYLSFALSGIQKLKKSWIIVAHTMAISTCMD
jgi:hypothetical protein